MAGSIMTLTFTVLLCLGLCRGPGDQVQTGVLPKPSIWADPGPEVKEGSSVTIWCQGSLQADGYFLYRDRGSQPPDKRDLQASSNKTRFLIPSMSSQKAGMYQCAYKMGGTLSERSEALLLVVTGEHSAPSLSAHPGPVVASGENVSLLCSSQSSLDTFHLLKEGRDELTQHRKSEWRSYDSRGQAVFPVGPVDSSHGGTYRCYGSSSSNPNVWSQPSDPLHLEVTGVYKEPSLSAQPGSLLLPGDNLTLQCHSEPGFDSFALIKDEGPTPSQSLHGQHSPDFPLGPVNLTHGGQYRCYSGHNLSYVWSAPSTPLDILIAGLYNKPSLSARPGPSVPWGAHVTLQCGSEVRADTFHLHREGSLDPPQQLRLQDTAAPSQANFTISPVTWEHNGTYRCYSSRSSSPFQLSQPSDPLELLVSVEGQSHRDSLPGLLPDPWDQVQTGVHPKPSIWADPGPRVSKGSPVTIWCQGSLQANGYVLYKERGSEPWDTSIPQASSNKTGFLIPSMSSQYAGQHQCAYSIGDTMSERSEPLLLVVTGEHSAPSLSAQAGPVVTSGGNVSLLCSSQSSLDTFHLLKEGGAELPQHRKSEWRSYDSRGQAVFPVGPVNTSHGGTYRCYGSSSNNPNVWSQPSDPLHLEVTGVYREPSLSAQPGSLLMPGDSLTLQCHSEPGFDRFALTKDEGLTYPQSLHGQHSPDFPLGPVNLTHGGRYRCYSGHNLSYVWSASSAPLDILIAGMSWKPSLSAQPGPLVPWGVNVTLQCGSEVRADTFHLHREGSLDPPQRLRLQDTPAPSQANFTISPVTWEHNGTYRCYSSRSSSPFQLSQPSDPLELVVSAQGLQLSLGVLIGISVALILLLSLLLFLLFRHQHQSKGRTSGAALKDPRPGDGMELDPQQNGPHDDPQEVTYTQVNFRSRPKQGMASSPSPLSEELLDRKGRQAEEDTQVDNKAAASEDPQDVTYAQLTLMTLRQETSAPPSSASVRPPDESCVYAALAFH